MYSNCMTTYDYARTSAIEQLTGLANQISKLEGASYTGSIDLTENKVITKDRRPSIVRQ